MHYRVRVPPSVIERIRSVEPSITEDVLRHLAALAESPRLATPIRGGDFDGLMAYEFRVTRLPISRVFAVLFRFDPDEQHLDVLDFGILTGQPPRLDPPAFRRDGPS